MRRDARISNKKNKTLSDKIILYSSIGVAILVVILIGLLMYSKSLSDDVKEGTMSLEEMANITKNTTQNTESASTDIGKTVEESKNEMNETNSTSINNANTNNLNTNNLSNNKNNVGNTTTNTTANNNTSAKATNADINKTTETKQELCFEKPVEGEIMREYAKDNLIYSATLEEWITHMGIDIKADKTTVVKSAEKGKIKSIKNDPRYGLTIVIEHNDGFQTVYSNLLTSEFVVEGEEVEKGQSIGTVGNTATFEIADEPHLHFEILKDSIPVDPNIYLK